MTSQLTTPSLDIHTPAQADRAGDACIVQYLLEGICTLASGCLAGISGGRIEWDGIYMAEHPFKPCSEQSCLFRGVIEDAVSLARRQKLLTPEQAYACPLLGIDFYNGNLRVGVGAYDFSGKLSLVH